MRRASVPRILVFAYACEPGAGSEPGAGWGVVRELSRIGQCTVLVAPEHVPAIRAWEERNEHPEIRFVEVAEPGRPHLWKWHRIPWFLAYLRWLRAARATGLDLHAENPFDLVAHATYAVYWLPSPCVEFEVPSLWGPVGGAVTTPSDLVPLLGWEGRLDEWLDRASVRFAARWPATRRTWARVDRALVQNRETLAVLPPSLQSRARVVNHVHFVDVPPSGRSARDRHVIWASPLESRKGPRLAVYALARTPPDVRLIMLGGGPEAGAVRRLAERLGVSDRLEMPGWVSREELVRLFSTAAAALFTGLREEGGLALAEAMSMGTPVVVLGHGGPRDIAARATDPSRVTTIDPAPVDEVADAMATALAGYVREPVLRTSSTLDVDGARNDLRKSVEDLL